MTPEQRDIESIGLTTEEWKVLVFGRGTIHPQKLTAARAAVVKLGRLAPEFARDTGALDDALRRIATTYPHRCLGNDELSHEERVRFLMVKDGCTAEEAEQQLAKVQEDNDRERRILGK